MKTMEHLTSSRPVLIPSRLVLLLILAMLYALAPAAFGQMGTAPRIVPNQFQSIYKSYFDDFDAPVYSYGMTNYVEYKFNGSDAASLLNKTNFYNGQVSWGGGHTNAQHFYQVRSGPGWPMNGGSNYCWQTNWLDGTPTYLNSTMVTNLVITCPTDYTFSFGYQNTLVIDDIDPWGLGDAGDFYESTYITTDARLWTGSSTNGSVTNLFKLHATVTSWTPGQTVTNSAIKIGGINCDTNGDIYIALPDNYWHTCTVTMPAGYSNYTYSMTVDRANLQFFRAGTNIANTTSSIIIGQKMAVTCAFQNPPTNNFATITNYQWVVEGSVVTNFFVSTDSNHTNGYPVSFPSAVWNTNRPAVQFYWHAPGTNKVYCLATARGYTIRSEAVYTVLIPDFILTNTVGATVTIDSTNYHEVGLWAHFGSDDTGPGMTFNIVTNMIVETNFTFQFVQVITNFQHVIGYGDAAFSIRTDPNYNDSVIDTSYPYNSDDPNATKEWDSPGVPLDFTKVDGGVTYYPSNIYYSFTAKMYLFYKSTEPSTDAIWVPLSVIPWNFSLDLRKTNTNNSSWSKYSIGVPTQPQASSKTYIYPSWKKNFKNQTSQFYPPN